MQITAAMSLPFHPQKCPPAFPNPPQNSPSSLPTTHPSGWATRADATCFHGSRALMLMLLSISDSLAQQQCSLRAITGCFGILLSRLQTVHGVGL